MDSGETYTHKFPINPHDISKVDIMYTNDTKEVVKELEKYERLLLRDGHRYVGLDLEYTKDQTKVVVIQLAMEDHVLVFHFYRSPDTQCTELRDFLEFKEISFTTVDMRNDCRLLAVHCITIPSHKWVDIHKHLNFDGAGRRTDMGDLAAAVIDLRYKHMKYDFPRNGHDDWEKFPLPKVNQDYAAIDGFVSFELYKRLKKIREGLDNLPAREVVCPSCEEAKRQALLPPGWRRVEEFQGGSYWDYVAYCNRTGVKFDASKAPAITQAYIIPTGWHKSTITLSDALAARSSMDGNAGKGCSSWEDSGRVAGVCPWEVATGIPEAQAAFNSWRQG